MLQNLDEEQGLCQVDKNVDCLIILVEFYNFMPFHTTSYGNGLLIYHHFRSAYTFKLLPLARFPFPQELPPWLIYRALSSDGWVSYTSSKTSSSVVLWPGTLP